MGTMVRSDADKSISQGIDHSPSSYLPSSPLLLSPIPTLPEVGVDESMGGKGPRLEQDDALALVLEQPGGLVDIYE